VENGDDEKDGKETLFCVNHKLEEKRYSSVKSVNAGRGLEVLGPYGKTREFGTPYAARDHPLFNQLESNIPLSTQFIQIKQLDRFQFAEIITKACE
jgi:hypothetical protein